MARSVEPTPKTDHPMWKLHHDTVKDYNNIKEKMKAFDNEEETFLEGIKRGYEDETADNKDEDVSEVAEDAKIDRQMTASTLHV